jgi:UDP-N-acetylglucosamine transferase subunit ALG13
VVLVSVGTGEQPFARLLNAVERLALTGFFEDEVVFVQYGCDPNFVPRATKGVPFLAVDEFDRMLREADLFVCQGGCGAIMAAVRQGMIPVAMPRLAEFGEVVNDHQVELVGELAGKGLLVPAWNASDLPSAIKRARDQQREPRPAARAEGALIGVLQRTIASLLIQ